MKGKLTAGGYLTDLNFGKNVYMHSMVFCKNKIWSFGGNTSASLTTTNTKDIRTYSIETDEWDVWNDSNMPSRIKLSAVAEKDGIIYFFGGVYTSNSNSNYAYKYNTETGEWVSLANVPTPFKQRHAVVIGNEIWLLGGTNTSMYVYDIEADTYRTITNSNKPSASVTQTSAYMAGKIYTFMGNTLYIYDIDTNTFSTKASPVTITSHSFAYRVDKTIYLAVPKSTSLTEFNVDVEIYAYNVNSGSFTLEQTITDGFLLDACMQYTGAIQDGNKLYFFVKPENHTTFQPVCLSYHVYVTDQEHIIETTDANHITGVNQVKSISIIGEEPVDTRLRFAMSFDDRETYHVFKEGAWDTIVSTDVLNDGMTMEEVMALTPSDFEKIINGTVNIDFVIGMDTTDEDVSPRLKNISVIKLQK